MSGIVTEKYSFVSRIVYLVLRSGVQLDEHFKLNIINYLFLTQNLR